MKTVSLLIREKAVAGKDLHPQDTRTNKTVIMKE
jgi:hypothetical protein